MSAWWWEKVREQGCGRRVLLCCAVPCCAVPCCAVLCRAVLCCAVLCCAALCCGTGGWGSCCLGPASSLLSPLRPDSRMRPPNAYTHQSLDPCLPRLVPPPSPAGMPNSKTGAKGNLRVRFALEFPRKQLSEQERAQLEAMLRDKM